MPAPHINVEGAVNQGQGEGIVPVIAQAGHPTLWIEAHPLLAYEIRRHLISLAQLVPRDKSGWTLYDPVKNPEKL